VDIKPDYFSIDQLFSNQYVFRIPKFQRNFAWEDPQINDFLSDINKCYLVRTIGGGRRDHFFGGVVCVKYDVPGSSRTEYDIVDGQQRLATFVLFVGSLIFFYGSLLGEASPEEKNTIEFQITDLTKKYIHFDDMVNRTVSSINKLEMSEPDKPFFEAILSNNPTEISRESHKRISYAYTQNHKYIQEIIDEHDSISEKLDVLQILREILADDITLIFISTQTAYSGERIH